MKEIKCRNEAGGYNHDYDFVTVVTRDIDARLEQWKSRQLAWELTA